MSQMAVSPSYLSKSMYLNVVYTDIFILSRYKEVKITKPTAFKKFYRQKNESRDTI